MRRSTRARCGSTLGAALASAARVAVNPVVISLVAISIASEAAAAEPVAESTRATARALGTAGVRALLDGDASLASERLERSFELFPTPTLGLWSARALAKRGLLVEAAERYGEVSRLSVDVGDVATQAAAQRDAESERAELVARIPQLTIRIAGTPRGRPTLLLDGRPRAGAEGLDPVALNPGRHEIVAEDERSRVTKLVELEERQRQTLELFFEAPLDTSPVEPAPAAPAAAAPAAVLPAAPRAESRLARDRSSLPRTAGWVSVGLGGAGLATGLITYLVGNSQHGELAADARCNDDVCQPELRAKVDHYSAVRALNIAGWISAGAFGATGVTLLWLSREPSGGDVELTATGNAVSVRGTF